MRSAKIHYTEGDIVLVNLGEKPENPEELSISSVDYNSLGVPMYGFKGKGDIRVGPNFILDRNLKRYPTLGECLSRK